MKSKTALKIVEWTSLPLLLFAALYFVSGYALTSETARSASLIMNFSRAQLIHLGRAMRLTLLTLFLLHSYAGAELLAGKLKARGRSLLGATVDYTATAFLLYVLWVVINAELRL
ncbi:hypothetical protein [Thermococcus sp.]|uniref:hypothetical protein n=1 Tax=Thermococcus sp. TaxID=35749 RepID=UPI00261A44FD|nr:hypothetical protein [Thermococcus sp.]